MEQPIPNERSAIVSLFEISSILLWMPLQSST